MTAEYPADSFKKCPKCGGDNIHKELIRISCNDCGFVFFFNTAAAVAGILVLPDGKIIMTRRAKNPAKDKLDLPGGFSDFHETAEESLRREIREELNLDVRELEYFGSFPNSYPYGGVTYHTMDIVFIGKVNRLEGLKAMDDVAGYEICNPKEINLDEIGLASIKRVIAKYQRKFALKLP